MADRYWVGGTGTWSSTNTANWSTGSGGSSGASVPTAADNVFFDANSNVGTGAFTVTMADSPRVCNDITISGLDGTMTLAGTNIGLTVSGSLSFPATNLTRTYTGTTTFNATTTGKTVTTNGVAFGGAVTFDGVGGAWTLGSAFSCGTSTLTLTNGTFNTSASNYSVTAAVFSSSNTNTRTITLNGSTVTLSAAGGWNISTSTNATLNAGTSTIICSGISSDFNGGSLTYYAVSFSSTSANSANDITGVNTFTNLSITAPSSNSIRRINLSANQTITGTLTVSSTTAVRRVRITSDTIGTSRTLTCAAVAAIADVDFRDITIAGAVGTLSGTRLGDGGGNSGITFDAPKTVYWNLAAGGNWSDTAWATGSSSGTPAINNFPLPQDTAIIENTGLNTSATITTDSAWIHGNIDTSGRTNAMTFAIGGVSQNINGNLSFGSGVTLSGTIGFIFANRSTKTLNSGSVTFDCPINISSPGGGIQLVTNNLTMGSTRALTLTNGTLDLNGRTCTVGTRFTTATGTKNLTFNGGTLVCPDPNTTSFNNAAPTGFTTTAGTGTGKISMTAATAKTFVGGDSTYNCTLEQAGAGALTITGSNTFTTISNSVQPTTITFTAGTTTTVTNWNVNGTAGNLVTIGSATAAQHTLSKASGDVTSNYLSISYSNATGGATWFAGSNSTNSGNNSGWLFSSLIQGAADISANALTDALGFRVELFSGSFSGTGLSSALGFRVKSFAGDISGFASVIGLGDRIRAFAGDISGSASVVGLGYRIKAFAGSIDTSANFSSDGVRVRLSTGDISGLASISSDSIRIRLLNADIFSDANIDLSTQALIGGNAVIVIDGNVVANGQIIGEEWSIVSPSSDIWLRQ